MNNGKDAQRPFKLYSVAKSSRSPDEQDAVSPYASASILRVPDIDRLIGEEIKARRIKLGLTLKDISRQLGIAVDVLEQYERGKIRATADAIVDLSYVLKCNPAHFFVSVSRKIAGASATLDKTVTRNDEMSAGSTMMNNIQAVIDSGKNFTKNMERHIVGNDLSEERED